MKKTTPNKYHYVYKTICLVTGHFYYGVHSTDNLNDRYIGSGIKFLNYVKKYGKQSFVRDVLHYFDTRDEAFLYEAELLTQSILNDEMCLNLTIGGKGYKHEYDETFKTRISKTRSMRIKAGNIIPTTHSEEHKQRLRENNPGGKATSKPIYQICPTTGAVIHRWDSSRQAGTKLGIRSWRNISHSASKLKTQVVGGFYWRWVNDNEVVCGQLVGIETLNAIRQDPGARAGRSVEQVDPVTGSVVRVWKNQCVAGKSLGIRNAGISLAKTTGSTFAGFLWR